MQWSSSPELNKIKNINLISDELEKANKVITKLTSTGTLNVTEINELIYAAAAVIAKEKRENKRSPHESKTPKWKARIQKAIDTSTTKTIQQKKLSPPSKQTVLEPQKQKGRVTDLIPNCRGVISEES